MKRKATHQQSLILTGTAEFSADEIYRYWLTRELGGDRPLVSCGLNPSTATAEEPDNTINKEIKFARRWGFGRLVKVNLYAFRTKSPAVMWKAAKQGVDIVGPDNDAAIRRAVDLCESSRGAFLVAWGGETQLDRVRHVVNEVIQKRTPLYCIATNIDGSPVHPLYQRDDSTYQAWRQEVS